MTKSAISDDLKTSIRRYIEDHPSPELVGVYLFFIEKKFNLQPVLYPKHKMIYVSKDEVVKSLEEKDELCHETEIMISFGEESVNEETVKIYICPFTGKVFGNNTHPNPQDAIYDWVSKCPENTERSGGLRVKRFFISEDPDVIKNYMDKTAPKKPVKKVVYSSSMNGKLFNAKEGVIKDFRENYLKPLTLEEVQNQNRYSIDEKLLAFMQEQLVEDKIAAFVDAMAQCDDFVPYVERWVD